MATSGGTASTGAAGDDAEPRILITIDQISDYLTCPLMFGLKHVRGQAIDNPNLNGIWASAIRDTVVWFYRNLMDRNVSWANLLDQWESAWVSTIERNKAPIGKAALLRNQGARELRTVFEDVDPKSSVLAVNYPCWLDIGAFRVYTEISVITLTARTVDMLVVDTSSVPLTRTSSQRRLDYLLLSSTLEKFVQRNIPNRPGVGKHVYSPISGSKAPITKVESVQATATWIKWVLGAIEAGYFYPRPGTYCTACPYEDCNALKVGDRALSGHLKAEES